MIRCKLKQVNDEVFCSSCAKVWGIDEPAPVCTEADQRKRKSDNEEERKRVGREMIKKMLEGLS